jgi:RimJ/RimL family protein N-acetyltransferase
MTIPTLSTSRLLLRPFALGDFDTYAAYWADESMARWSATGAPVGRADAWRNFLRHSGHWMMLGFGIWAVEEKSTGVLIGEAGFVNLKRDYDPMVNDIPEIGWAIVPAAQGKGYATEAAQECIRWGRDHFGPIRVLAAMNAANTASRRVAEKCGFRECLRRDFNGRPSLFLDRTL